MRKYPQPSDYQAAVQNPKLVFAEQELQSCRVRKNPLGLPAVSTGQFAVSFYLEAQSGQKYVVRCFKTDRPDRQARYSVISRFLNDNPREIFLDVDYLERGILVDGQWYPIVKMPLVDGMTFHRYIEGEITAKRSIADMPDKFRRLVAELEKLGAAHGDLQHGNIMVQQRDRALVLIDYDGMYVPALKGRKSEESGNAEYQHPERDDQFGPELDRFSSLVIDMALQALTSKPELWTKYSNGDNMLFRQKDFENPDQSKLLVELDAIPALRAQVAAFRSICKGPLTAVPRLTEFVAGKVAQVEPVLTNWLPPVPKKRQTVFNAHNRDELLRHVGEQITIVGRIVDFKEGTTQYRGLPYVFLNFGDYRAGHLTLVIWSDVLDLFRQQQRRARDYVNQWVQVSGMLTTYKPSGDRNVQAQIVLEVPSQIAILTGGEAEASQLLASPAAPQPPPPVAAEPGLQAARPSLTLTASASPQTPVQPLRPLRSIDGDLNRLYGTRTAAPQLAPSAASSPVVPPTQAMPTAMTPLGIHFLPPWLSYGSLQGNNVASRQLRIMNVSSAAVRLSIEGMPSFLTARQPIVNCPAKGYVDVDVQLDAAQIPPVMLESKATVGTKSDQEFLLKDAAVLIRCGGISEKVAVTATVVSPVAVRPIRFAPGVAAATSTSPAFQPSPSALVGTAPPAARLVVPPAAPPPPQSVPSTGTVAASQAAAAQLGSPAASSTVSPTVQHVVPPPTAANPLQSSTGPAAGAAPAAHRNEPAAPLSSTPSTAPSTISPPAVAAPPQKLRNKKLVAASWIVSAAVFLIAIYFRFPDAGAQIVRAATSGAYFRTEAAQPPLTPARPTPPAASSLSIPAPSAADVTQDVAAPFAEAGSAASVCPEDLPVELVQPQYILTTDTSRFVWHTADELPSKCGFQIKLWREGRPRVTVNAQDAVLGSDGDYELMITLSDIFSGSELEPGEFSWTLEVAPADTSGQALATAAEPVTFSWVPGTPTETP